MRSSSVVHLADSIIYLSSLLRAESRPIDRYIDYFGGAGRLRSAAPGIALRAADSLANRRPAATPGPGESPTWPLAFNDAEVK